MPATKLGEKERPLRVIHTPFPSHTEPKLNGQLCTCCLNATPQTDEANKCGRLDLLALRHGERPESAKRKQKSVE